MALLVLVLLSHSNHTTARRHRHHHGHGRDKRQHSPESYVLDVPGPETGDWEDWSSPAPCSRTCGGGVSYQTRQCRQDSTIRCEGATKRYFSCNIQDCPDGSVDFRKEQCSSFDSVPFVDVYYTWVPFTKAANKCELNCMPKGERFYFRHREKVADGTLCDEERLDICVDGKCLPVGCDHMLGSSAKEDQCRECGGDGSSCNTVRGNIDNDDFQVGYNDLMLIPAGATNIRIQEIKPSNNYLAIRNMTGHYYLNGNWRIDFPRSIRARGTIFHYERKPHGFFAPEIISALGPTLEPIYIVLLYRGKNLGVEYEYSIPKGTVQDTDPEGYSWVYNEFGPCSATCGGGLQSREVWCAKRRDSAEVTRDLCNEAMEPPPTQECAPEPCAPQWTVGQWGSCSETCGFGGTQTRQVVCEQIICGGRASLVNSSECEQALGPAPPTNQACPPGPPCPTWHIGPWKPCDRLCGNGQERRDVICFRKIDGRIEKMSDEACPMEKPPTEMACQLRPCEGVDWVTTDWSGCDDKCGLAYETRRVVCATEKGELYPDAFCQKSQVPELKRECNATAACKHQWFASQWSECSAQCGLGLQSRKVFCGSFTAEGVTRADDSLCDAAVRYEDSKNCTGVEQCKGSWFAGPWSACSKPCGSGQRTRKVLCMLNNTAVQSSQCDMNSIQSSSDDCNNIPCGTDQIITVVPEHKVYEDYEYEDDCDEDYTDDFITTEGVEAFTSELGGSGWSPEVTELTTAAAAAKRRRCKRRRKKSACLVSEFGCCYDNVTVAQGPFNKGCPVVETCQDTKDGCCEDGVSPAKGPNYEGCPPSQCNLTLFGCCPDGVSIALGNDFEGCPEEPTTPSDCKTSQFGCCPDGATSASGPELEGCEGVGGCNDTEYGCCPDGLQAAAGPDDEGCDIIDLCGCENTKYGCCPDKRTPVPGPDGGCDCAASLYSCCPDGVSEALGEHFEGCDDVPLEPRELCTLQKERGTCRDYSPKWFFDTEYGGCSRFWYSGCEGNENRFKTQDECKQTCVEPTGRDACFLPKIEGPCDSHHPKWYYDTEMKQCGQFVYGGCLGNGNKFETKEQCEELCVTPDTLDACDKPVDQGPCQGNFTRWFYDKESEVCTTFNYGGCKGNSNNFLTEVACQLKCLQPGNGRESSRLTVVRANVNDTGLYKCEAANQYGSTHTEVNITVEVPVKTIINMDKSVFPVDSDISIPCDVDGYPVSKVTWYKDNLPVQSSEKYKISESSRLTVVQANVNDTGLYKCEAANQYGSTHTEVNITVEVPVKTIINMDKSVFPVDSDISIPCDVDGYPVPKVTWYKDNLPVQSSEKYKISESSRLTVVQANVNDTGLYKCEAANQYGSTHTEVNITVEVPVKTIINMDKSVFPVDSDISIPCDVDGYPVPKVTWYKDNLPVQSSEKYKISESSRLTVVQANVNDTGLYKCEAANQYGSTHTEVNITVEVPVKTIINMDKSVFPVDSDISIPCDVDGYPVPKVTWYKDNLPVQSSEKYKISESSRLTVVQANVNDTGLYKCEAANQYGYTHTEVNITVEVPVKTIINMDKSVFPVDSDISIPCDVDGYPVPKVTWYKDNLPVQSSEKYKISESSRLTVVQANVNDTGLYKCEAANQYGSTHTEVNITVEVPVKTIINMDKSVFPVDSDISIPCDVDGYPVPKVTWYKDNLPVQSSEKYKISESSRLTVVQANVNDTGLYKCEAANQYGSTHTEVNITVEVPVKTIINMDKSVFPVDSDISIPCDVDGYPVSKVTWYKDNLPVQSSEKYKISESSRLTVVQANVNDTGLYKCEAANQYGSTHTEVNITVEVPVKTIINMDKSVFPVDSDISIPCDVDGYPVPKVTWYKDNLPVQSSEKYKISESSRLTVVRANVNDTGLYKCEAANQYGSTHTEVNITVEGIYVDPFCTDNEYIANCHMVVRGKYCTHKYYSRFCCKSCTLAGLLPSVGQHLDVLRRRRRTLVKH